MAILGWSVLFLVFVDALLAVAAAAVWGAHVGGPVLAILMGLLTVLVCFLFLRRVGATLIPTVAVRTRTEAAVVEPAIEKWALASTRPKPLAAVVA